MDRNIDLPTQNFELLNGGRPIDIGSDKQGALAVLFEPQRQFGGHRRLTCALQSDKHDGERGIAGKIERRSCTQQLDEFVVDDLYDLLGGSQAVHDFLAHGAGADAVDELFDYLEIHIGFEQGKTYFAQGHVDIALGELALARKSIKDPL